MKSIGTDFGFVPTPKDQPLATYLWRPGAFTAADAQAALSGVLGRLNMNYSPIRAWIAEVVREATGGGRREAVGDGLARPGGAVPPGWPATMSATRSLMQHDDAPEVATGPGWELRRGDALAVLRTLPDELVDAVITDPPYSSGGLHRAARMAKTSKKYVDSRTATARPEFLGDNRDQRSFLAWCTLWLAECWRVSKVGAPICVFTDWRQLPRSTRAGVSARARQGRQRSATRPLRTRLELGEELTAIEPGEHTHRPLATVTSRRFVVACWRDCLASSQDAAPRHIGIAMGDLFAARPLGARPPDSCLYVHPSTANRPHH